jgi:hypothetical protein
VRSTVVMIASSLFHPGLYQEKRLGRTGARAESWVLLVLRLLRIEQLAVGVPGTQAGGTDPWTVAIFGGGYNSSNLFDDVNNGRLETVTGTGDQFVSFTRAEADIAGFLLLSSSRREGIDDVRFAGPTVPEPRTLVLLGVGVLMLVLGQTAHRAMQAVRRRTRHA